MGQKAFWRPAASGAHAAAHARGVGEDERALREPGRVVDVKGAARLPLRLPVRELRDRHAEVLLERLLRVQRVAGDAEQARAALLELGQNLLVEVELVGADRR